MKFLLYIGFSSTFCIKNLSCNNGLRNTQSAIYWSLFWQKSYKISLENNIAWEANLFYLFFQGHQNFYYIKFINFSNEKTTLDLEYKCFLLFLLFFLVILFSLFTADIIIWSTKKKKGFWEKKIRSIPKYAPNLKQAFGFVWFLCFIMLFFFSNVSHTSTQLFYFPVKIFSFFFFPQRLFGLV